MQNVDLWTHKSATYQFFHQFKIFDLLYSISIDSPFTLVTTQQIGHSITITWSVISTKKIRRHSVKWHLSHLSPETTWIDNSSFIQVLSHVSATRILTRIHFRVSLRLFSRAKGSWCHTFFSNFLLSFVKRSQVQEVNILFENIYTRPDYQLACVTASWREPFISDSLSPSDLPLMRQARPNKTLTSLMRLTIISDWFY